MKRLLTILAVVMVFTAAFGASGTGALAQGVAPSVTPAAADSAAVQQPAPAPFTLGQLMRVKLSVPFVWLRTNPISTATWIDTVGKGEFIIIAAAQPVWDGVQYWWNVNRANGAVRGWVEQNSIEPATGTPVPPSPTPVMIASVTPASGPAAWVPDTPLIAAPGVPFIWLRSTPAPNAEVRATIFPGTVMYIQGGVAPSIDQYGQYWWLVRVPAYNRLGWVEQKSMAAAPPTAIPSPTTVPSPTIPKPPTNTPVPPSPAAKWVVPNVLFVKPSIPFVWLRAFPSSISAVVDTIQLGGFVIVRGGPTFDGTQWWWQVQSAYSGHIGWVEQNSVDLAAYKTATPVGVGAPDAAPTDAAPTLPPTLTPATTG